jgi:multiple sugar transport system ATP-binding protein
MGRIVLDEVVKEYRGGVRAVDGVSLVVQDGEFLVLVGPSGCGKSTLLRLIAGLETVSEGGVAIGERDVTYTEPRDRDIAMVFQSYALYPHMTVRQNLGYGLRVRGTAKADTAERVAGVARVLALEELLERRPSQLSGGQRQRVAIGRAMVREPAAFLMDEPLSNLDAKLRVAMRAELAQLHRRLGITTVYVTHDQVEAMTLGQRVAVMRDGVVQQVDRPQVLYHHPRNLFVAAFIGSPAMNLLRARVEGDALAFGGLRVPLDAACRTRLGGDRELIVGIRPECFEDAAFAAAELPRVQVDVDILEELGADAHVFFALDAPAIDRAELRDAADGEQAMLLARERVTITARVHARTRARAGERLELALDPRRFHFFDPDSGDALDGGAQPLTPPAITPPMNCRVITT